ncbi:MAG: tetratricopeptide repeat protein [Gemmatimonadota bacterium]
MPRPAVVVALLAALVAPAFAAPAFADGGADAPPAYLRLDPETTYRLYRQAAEQGDAAAQTLVGNMHVTGQGVPRDYAEAAKWYRKAADQGNAEAQYNLGMMYANGQGVPRDCAEAAAWYRKAADQGNADALCDLGVLYEEGQGVPRDPVLAYMYFEIAAAKFESPDSRGSAMENRDRVASGMTLAQIAEARRRAREWKPANPGRGH